MTGPSGAGQPGTIRIPLFTAGALLGPAGAAPPGYSTYGTLGMRSFQETRNENVWIAFPVPTNRDPSTDVKLIISFTNEADQVGDTSCRWVVEYVTMDPGEDYDAKTVTTLVVNKALATGQSARVDTEAEFTLAYNDADNPLSKKKAKVLIYRDATNAADTVSGNAGVDVVYLEYTMDRLGS